MLPSQGYSASRRPAPVGESDRLYFVLELRRQEKEKNLHQMTAAEKVEFCQQRRDVGKALFGSGQPRSALRQYEKALQVLDSLSAQGRGASDESVALTALMKVNAAACHQRLRSYIDVLQLCSEVLQQQPGHAKALYRRAAAHQAREEWDEATADYESLLESDLTMDKSTKEKVHRQLQSIAQHRRRVDRSQKQNLDGFLLKRSNQPSSDASSSLLYADRIAEQDEQERAKTLWGQIAQRWAAFAAAASANVKWLYTVTLRRCRRTHLSDKFE